MKRPLQLSLAIALALGVTDAFALGLGAIQVRSGLNQPLVAEIPVILNTPNEAEGLVVQLASVEDFERVGLSRSNISVPLQFTMAKNARGETVVRVTSEDVVRDPFLGVLVEANWPKGRLLREYTVLLDPPVMAPAVKGSSAVAAGTPDAERAPTQALPPSSKPATPAPSTPARPATPPRATAATPPPAAAPAPTPPRVSGTGYGPVAAGETLGEIARATRSGDVNVNQMMLALLKANPNAFYRDNVNALKRGSVLRIPSAEEIAATGTAREAAAAVRAQIDDWRGGASTPTRVADTGATSTPSSASSTSRPSSTSSGERLALVPPREGSASQNAADRPAGGTPGGTGDAASKAELARVKEALTSREQESAELKSRVKDLEEIRTKNDKLISLQNSELAELRDKLQKMQDDALIASAKPSTPAAAATPPAAATPTPPPVEPVTTPAAPATTPPKDDIWGGDTKPADPAATAQGDTPVAPPVDTPADPTVTTETPATATAPVDPAAPSTPPAATTEPPVAAPVEPAVTEPAATTPAATPAPATEAQPWYLEPWALGAAGVGGLLLVLLGVAGLRKRKPAATERASIADSFGDSPVPADDGFAAAPIDAEEQALIDQVRRDPGNAGAHLELLSLYYANRDATKFEAAAEEMYAFVADPNQPEWREARAMGEELVPHNPLFGGTASLTDFADDSYTGAPRDDGFSFDEPTKDKAPDYDSYVFDDPPPAPEPAADPYRTAAFEALPETPAAPPSDFEFDFDDRRPPAKPAEADTGFSFDLPPIEPFTPPPPAPVPAPREEPEAFDFEPVTPPAPEPEDETATTIDDDEFFAGDDAIGTKLDLAKAYLDMGDPEGARAMLEEVLAEGSPSQQAEARKLIGEIG